MSDHEAAAIDGGKAPPRSAAACARRPAPADALRAIWLALAALLVVGAHHRAAQHPAEQHLAVIPLAAFLSITAMGQALVLMARGIDLSIPAIVTLSSTLLLGVSGGSRRRPRCRRSSSLLLAATLVGLINGILVAAAASSTR